jgi:hypothetical protein
MPILSGHAVAIYYAMRDWIEPDGHDMPDRTRKLLSEILIETRELLKTRDVDLR